MRRILLALIVFAGLAAPAQADPPGTGVPIYFAAFGTPKVAVLAGDSVTWHNDSVRAHTVTSVDGSFASIRIVATDSFSHRFDTVGAAAYYCSLHPAMRGEVDVYRALLDAPSYAAAPGRPYLLTGRAAGTSVTIQPGGVKANVAADGTFSALVRPVTSTSYTAVVDGDSSPPVQVLVLDRKVTASARGRTVTASVAPGTPGATVVLQMHLKEHFGWWPVATGTLDRQSRVRFTVNRRARARVVLTASDGATPLARSGVFSVR